MQNFANERGSFQCALWDWEIGFEKMTWKRTEVWVAQNSKTFQRKFGLLKYHVIMIDDVKAVWITAVYFA